MAISIITTIAKLAVLLLIVSIPCLSPSSASRLVTNPQEAAGNDHRRTTAVNASNGIDRNQKQQQQKKLPERGIAGGVVMLPPQASSSSFGASNNNNNTASVHEYCDYFCNDSSCAQVHPRLCDGYDLSKCFVGCDCADYVCTCLCYA